MNARPDMNAKNEKLSAATRGALVCRYRDAIREEADNLQWCASMLRELALQGSESALELYIKHSRLVVLELIAINKQLKRVVDWKLPNLDEGAA